MIRLHFKHLEGSIRDAYMKILNYLMFKLRLLAFQMKNHHSNFFLESCILFLFIFQYDF
jgi:hypothetical protein